jgi:hypothetical protein
MKTVNTKEVTMNDNPVIQEISQWLESNNEEISNLMFNQFYSAGDANEVKKVEKAFYKWRELNNENNKNKG